MAKKLRSAVTVSIEITGAKEALAEIERRDRNVAKKAIKRSVTLGGRVLRKAARPLVNTESKTLRNSLGVREVQYSNAGYRVVRVAVVGPRVDGQKYWKNVRRIRGKMFAVTSLEKPEKISHLVSGGANPHFIRLGKTRLIAHPGFSGSRFMERAAQIAGPSITRIMEQTIFDAMNGLDSLPLAGEGD